MDTNEAVFSVDKQSLARANRSPALATASYSLEVATLWSPSLYGRLSFMVFSCPLYSLLLLLPLVTLYSSSLYSRLGSIVFSLYRLLPSLQSPSLYHLLLSLPLVTR